MTRKYYDILVCSGVFGKNEVSPTIDSNGNWVISMTDNEWTELEDNIGM